MTQRQSQNRCTMHTIYCLPLAKRFREKGYQGMSVGDAYRQLADFLIPWLNIVHCGPCLLMSPLSSPYGMETAPGFSPWGLAMGHCGTSCLVLNFPINSFNQRLFARAGGCRERCHAARSQISRCSQLLTQEKQTPDEVASANG